MVEEIKECCLACGVDITEKVAEFSRKVYNRPLCMSCQNKAKNANKEKTEIVSKATVGCTKGLINLGGKEYATLEYLLNKAHDTGLLSIKTELIKCDPYIFKAIVDMGEDKIFTAYGDASDNNVGAIIRPHIIRMAETRSIVRALRFATNTSACAREELGDM